MIISLLGYMGSGKTHISKILSLKTGFKFIDLDKEISRRNRMQISEIFAKRGEIYFRKRERETLEEILATTENAILSLGGGTPAYYNNMQVINQNSVSFYLKAPISLLAERILIQKEKRPVIASVENEDLPEFIAKHLFERIPYYTQAMHTIDVNGKEADKVADEIISKIY